MNTTIGRALQAIHEGSGISGYALALLACVDCKLWRRLICYIAFG